MPKLNQIVAVANGKKNRGQQELTGIYQKLQKPDLFSGLSKTYEPTQEDGDSLPAERTLVKYTAEKAIEEASRAIGEVIDVVATQDAANTEARADVVVNGEVLLSQVPVTTLMFLEKQLTDIRTFVSKIPVLDAAYDWKYDENKDVFVSDETKTNRTKKVVHHKVVYDATPEHPAQIAEVSEDVKVGVFTTTKFSGAIKAKRKREMIERVQQLQEAVKFAREQANSIEVADKKLSVDLLKYVFNG